MEYIFANDKMKNVVQNVKVLRYSDLYVNYSLLLATVTSLAGWRKSKTKRINVTQEVYKTYLLQEESVRNLCRNRLLEQLIRVPTSQDIDEEWNNIRACIESAITEPRKQKVYKEPLQESIQEARSRYTQKRCQATNMKSSPRILG